ncbi:MAG: MlaD family protein [Rikenellaceae bacterium]
MKREVKIGIFAIVIVCCSWAGIRFLSGIDIFRRNITYYANYDKVDGINTASPILLQGVKIGKVTDIHLDPANSDKVTLKLSVKRRYQLPVDSEAEVFSPGIMSSMAIGVTYGKSQEMLRAGDTISSHFEAGMMDVAAEKLMGIADQISEVGEQLTTTLGAVNELLAKNSGNIDSTLSNLNALSANLSQLIVSQGDNIAEIADGLSKFSSSLGGNSEHLESILANLNSLSTQLAEADIANTLSATVAELNTTLGKINAAEGSAGKLINDEQLYENLSAVSGSLNELIIDLQANPKRYVHFSLFGSKSEE